MYVIRDAELSRKYRKSADKTSTYLSLRVGIVWFRQCAMDFRKAIFSVLDQKQTPIRAVNCSFISSLAFQLKIFKRTEERQDHGSSRSLGIPSPVSHTISKTFADNAHSTALDLVWERCTARPNGFLLVNTQLWQTLAMYRIVHYQQNLLQYCVIYRAHL